MVKKASKKRGVELVGKRAVYLVQPVVMSRPVAMKFGGGTGTSFEPQTGAVFVDPVDELELPLVCKYPNGRSVPCSQPV